MDLVWYLTAFRRRWPVIAASLVVAVTAGFLTTETLTPAAPKTPTTYRAETLLASDGSSIGDLPGTTKALATYATIAQVANRAAKELGYRGDPLKLVPRIQALPDPDTPFLTIVASGPNKEKTERTADAFAAALTDFLSDYKEGFYRPLIAALDKSIRGAQDERTDLAYRSQQAILQTELTSPVGVTVVQPAVATEVEQETGFAPPDSGLVRLGVAAMIGLLAGAGLVLLLERFDTKIRTSEQAAEWFGYPVIAEIPSIRREHRKGVVTADHPTSPIADAFRLLGAGMHVAVRPRSEEEETSSGGRIVLVTSSGPAEGKSTVVANLAAALAEEGKRVIVFSADLRRPMLHDMLSADRRPGLVQAARDTDGGIRRYKQLTRLNRVLFVPSGGASERPAEVLASTGVLDLLREARSAAEWVVVDTAPILLAAESAPLIDEADVVLLVARAGVTSSPVAEKTRETMHRLGADAAWVVLNAAPESPVPSGYRRYHVVTEKTAAGASPPKGFPR